MTSSSTYVDDLIMFYPPDAVDADDIPVAGSIYGRFIADMDENWHSEDEGELSDILNIQVTRRHDGAVHVSQEQYARRFVEQFRDKLLERLRGPPPVRHVNMPPYTPLIAERVKTACDDTTERDPADVHLSQCFSRAASRAISSPTRAATGRSPSASSAGAWPSPPAASSRRCSASLSTSATIPTSA